MMLARKCDICGAEMRITSPRYKVTFDGWFYTQEKDICIDCFERIADEIKQADTPQTDEQRKVQEAEHRMANVIAGMNTPQTDCENCKHYNPHHEAIACERCLDGKYSRYEPQTDCGWGEPND